MHEFQFLINGELVTYSRYEDIPKFFDHLIKFLPEIPEPEGEDGDHTEEQHEEFEMWNTRLQQILEKENASSL